MMDETFLTTEEVLEYLQVNLRTVYRLIKAGKIPAVRVGRQWRFRKRDIDAWLDSLRRPLVRRRAPPAHACSSSTMRQAFATCSRRPLRSPNTTWTLRPTAARPSNACGCIRTTCSSPT